MANTLETLLSQLRDGTAGPADLERARVLVQVDERIPPELRDEVLRDPADAEADAVGLLALLGIDDDLGSIAAAIREEAGAAGPNLEWVETMDLDSSFEDTWEPVGRVLREGLVAAADGVDVSDAVVRRLPMTGFAWGPVLVDAVANEAGVTDVADGVFVALDGSARAPVATAILAEAGEVDVVSAVMAALAAELPMVASPPVAEAVRAEAGTVDVVPRVMAIVSPDPARLPRPANDNRGWAFGAVVMAATALLAIAVGRLATPLTGADPGLTFAHAGDVVVEDLSYADNVQVFQTEGDQGAAILWLDEEA